ncbi:MAG: LpxI family protein [Candidatus Methylacidiphilales bacterium]
MSQLENTLGLIAGKGTYPQWVIREARAAGVVRVVMVAFEGETDPDVAARADEVVWIRVGQLGRLIRELRGRGVERAMMAGQITPGRLFDLRPDWKALTVLLKLKRRNAETLFGAVADALEEAGVTLLPATSYLEGFVAGMGRLAGPRPDRQLRWDVETGWPVLQAVSAMDVGQCVVVKKGTILAVEGYDGTNATIRRGGELGRGGATLCKGSKARQDPRFDVPVVGLDTMRVCLEAGVKRVVVETGRTLILDIERVREYCDRNGLMLWGHQVK